MNLIGAKIRRAVEEEITNFADSRLSQFVTDYGSYVIKFVQSKWAKHYANPNPLKISETPALTWGTATYVTPLAFPLSSALYGRIGVVTKFDPSDWQVFDATSQTAINAYINWVRSQPSYGDLLLTVHSTYANHLLRNQFREQFNIDCVLFHPDQEAEVHTNRVQDVWMAVTDWRTNGTIETTISQRLQGARFTVLIDEDFLLEEQGLPIRIARRQIEHVTENIAIRGGLGVSDFRADPNLWQQIVDQYENNGYLHIFIEP